MPLGMAVLAGSTCVLFLSVFAMTRYQRRPNWLDYIASACMIGALIFGAIGVWMLHPGNTKAMEPFFTSCIQSTTALLAGWGLHAIIGAVLPLFGLDPDQVEEYMRRQRKKRR